ncbi:MAG: FAD:protein FMN transferase [Proteobacteria bacterium]|nr:FAD:protein FMN transferase [Pseudomonadota bacterium]
MRIILDASVSTVKRLRVSLGTLVAIEATADSSRRAEAAIEAAYEAISHVDCRMHPHKAGSDLARINGSPLHVPAQVHPSVGRLLDLARQLHSLTDGVFDPCLPARPGRLSDIHVSGDETEVVCHMPVALDFGGFAKGYAVDCAVESLLAAGCTAGLVNAGGDLRVFGPRAEPVFLRGPAGELTSVELTDAALAVSDAGSQQRPAEHQGYYVHDRRPGHDESHMHLSVGDAHTSPFATTYAAVIASTALVADALAKCVLLCPSSVAARTLHAWGASHAGNSRPRG